jgi:hypothetical protein
MGNGVKKMIQLYALSIIFNTIGGLILTSEYLLDRFKGFSKVNELINSKGSKLVVGIVAVVIGIFNLFAPMDGIPIIGDLLPSAASLGIGATLIFDFMKESATVTSETLTRIDEMVLNNKIIIGFAGMGITIVHLLFPTVPLL